MTTQEREDKLREAVFKFVKEVSPGKYGLKEVIGPKNIEHIYEWITRFAMSRETKEFHMHTSQPNNSVDFLIWYETNSRYAKDEEAAKLLYTEFLKHKQLNK